MPNALIWKVDFKKAFWHIVVASRDTRLCAYYHLDGTGYLDLTISFGGRASAFHWILELFRITASHYLDDLFGTAAAHRCQRVYNLVRLLASALGLTVSPTQCTFGPVVGILGVVVDARKWKAWGEARPATRHRLSCRRWDQRVTAHMPHR